MAPYRMKTYTIPANRRCGTVLWLGFAAGVMAQLSRAPRPEVTCTDLRKHDFPTSMQRLGVRLTDRVRRAFRFRWIREIL